jgi:hypothetical protein
MIGYHNAEKKARTFLHFGRKDRPRKKAKKEAKSQE